MFSDINRGAAVLAAERQALKDANYQQNNRRGNANRRVGRQKTNQRRRAAHDQQRHQERILASDQIADAAKEERAKRTNDEAHRKRREVSDQRHCVVALRIKERRNYCGQAAKDVEVIPLDHCADRRGADDLPDSSLFIHAFGSSLSRQHSGQHLKRIVHGAERSFQLRVSPAFRILAQFAERGLNFFSSLRNSSRYRSAVALGMPTRTIASPRRTNSAAFVLMR